MARPELLNLLQCFDSIAKNLSRSPSKTWNPWKVAQLRSGRIFGELALQRLGGEARDVRRAVLEGRAFRMFTFHTCTFFGFEGRKQIFKL